MKLYIAGNYKEREKIRRIMDRFESEGHEITNDWTVHEDFSQAGKWAVEDVEGVKDADILICYFENAHTYRGSFVEMGVALGLGKPVIIIGDAGDECIFTKHPLIHKLHRTAPFSDIKYLLSGLGCKLQGDEK